MCLVAPMYEFLLGKYLKVKLMDHNVCIMLKLSKYLVNQFFKRSPNLYYIASEYTEQKSQRTERNIGSCTHNGRQFTQ